MARRCTNCGHESPDGARFCFNTVCGQALDAASPGSEPSERNRSGRMLLVVVAGVAVIALAAVLTIVLTRNEDGAAPVATTVPFTGPATTLATSAATTATPPTTRGPVTALARSRIVQATASSTLPEDTVNRITYGIENTLDGDLTTAWNSAGSEGELVPPEGQWLEYRFAAQTPITQVRIINGYDPRNGRSAYTDNHRIKTFRLTTGVQTLEGTLVDDETLAPNLIRLNGTPVTFVRITVISTYPPTGKAYDDVGVTEVAFFSGG
jgi:hypothetical protein